MDQSSASASLYEYNPGFVNASTAYENGSKVQPFSFACELAHGSNQVRISGFSNIPEMYHRIAERFSIPVTQIMYCTLDTSSADMTKLLGNQLSFNHVIYAHTRGQTKEVRFIKSAEALGITVTDNKFGGVFIKRISPTGVLSKVLDKQPNSICPGDLIECINGRSFITSRHVDVVKFLKELPLKSEIVLRLISPEKSLIPGVSKRQKRTGAFGRQTIRITATGAEITAAVSPTYYLLNQDQTRALRQLADAVEDFLGIADEELAQSIFDLECRSKSKEDFLSKLNEQYSDFKFPDHVAQKFWMSYEYYLDAVQGAGKW